MGYGAAEYTTDITVYINTIQTTQNKCEEEVSEFRVLWGFWKTPGHHPAAALLSVWPEVISKVTSVSRLWMCPGKRRNVLGLPSKPGTS